MFRTTPNSIVIHQKILKIILDCRPLAFRLSSLLCCGLILVCSLGYIPLANAAQDQKKTPKSKSTEKSLQLTKKKNPSKFVDAPPVVFSSLSTLRGLKNLGIRVYHNEGSIRELIAQKAKTKIGKTGIHVLNKKEIDSRRDWPMLNFYINKMAGGNDGCVSLSIYLSLTQVVQLQRNPSIIFQAGTWGSGKSKMTTRAQDQSDLLHMAQTEINNFINAYLEANIK